MGTIELGIGSGLDTSTESRFGHYFRHANVAYVEMMESAEPTAKYRLAVLLAKSAESAASNIIEETAALRLMDNIIAVYRLVKI